MDLVAKLSLVYFIQREFFWLKNCNGLLLWIIFIASKKSHKNNKFFTSGLTIGVFFKIIFWTAKNPLKIVRTKNL
jgi:hypothetical protein